jgi:hypothetical protein
MSPTTKRQLQRVTEALSDLFSSTSVPTEETLEALEEVQADVESQIEALKS